MTWSWVICVSSSCSSQSHYQTVYGPYFLFISIFSRVTMQGFLQSLNKISKTISVVHYVTPSTLYTRTIDIYIFVHAMHDALLHSRWNSKEIALMSILSPMPLRCIVVFSFVKQQHIHRKRGMTVIQTSQVNKKTNKQANTRCNGFVDNSNKMYREFSFFLSSGR